MKQPLPIEQYQGAEDDFGSVRGQYQRTSVRWLAVDGAEYRFCPQRCGDKDVVVRPAKGVRPDGTQIAVFVFTRGVDEKGGWSAFEGYVDERYPHAVTWIKEVIK